MTVSDGRVAPDDGTVHQVLFGSHVGLFGSVCSPEAGFVPSHSDIWAISAILKQILKINSYVVILIYMDR